MSRPAFWLYTLFVASWFTHAGARFPILGAVRFDLLLVLLLAVPAFLALSRERAALTSTDKALWTLIAWVLITIPLVEWPGSVIQKGIPEFVKAIIFYFFTVAFVKTQTDLKRFIALLIGLQAWRVLEPLYLHLAFGYWGSVAHMQGENDFLERLSGAPHDVINPNGLAFVICTVIPFALWLGKRSWWSMLVLGPLVALCLYALILTGSRTGFLGLAVIYLAILAKSRRRLLVTVVGVAVLAYGATKIDADLQDRYLSIVGLGSKNLGTATGRLEAIGDDFAIALRRPLFGHGLGASAEANYHFAGYGQLSHNLYAEVAQELGFIGLAIFLWLMLSISRPLLALGRSSRRSLGEASYLDHLTEATLVWFAVVLLFSLASYGLSSYEWYLLAGLSVVIPRLAAGNDTRFARPALEAGAARPVVYVDFEQAIRGAGARNDPGVFIDGDPLPGAIEFLREAAGPFSVVVCSPHCGSADGTRALSNWMRENGAPVSQLRFSSTRPVVDPRRGQIIGIPGRWPTIEELYAIANQH